MIRLYIALGITIFIALYYFTYRAPVYTTPETPAIDMGIWSESNKGNSLAEK